jgi:hypothetical protein
MTPDPRRARRVLRPWFYGPLLLCLVAAVVAYSSATGSAAVTITTGSLPQFHSAVIARMHAERLRFLWVACVRSGNRFRGVPVVRCNVDFGEPHIVAYCSVFRDGRLLTSEDDPAIPCAHDNAGWSDPVVTYG